MRLIINADDLGISQEVNDAIFGLMAEGKITSATMLANGPAVEDAAKRLAEFPQCSFGVHLNLTEFKPVSAAPRLARVGKSGSGAGVPPAGGVPHLFSRARRPPSRAGGPRHYFPDTLLKPILNSTGAFAGNIRAVSLTPSLREGIYAEWSAQVQKLIKLGLRPSHLDSHHHVHTIAGLFWVLKKVQKRFGLRKVRTSLNLYPVKAPASRLLLVQKRLWNATLRRFYRTTTTDGFTTLVTFLELAQAGKVRTTSIELMAHPGLAKSREESAALCNAWRDKLNFASELISFAAL